MIWKQICILIFLILSLQNGVKAENNDEEYILTGVDIYNCDYTRFETELATLKAGNDLLKERFDTMQLQMEKQENFLQKLETKIDDIPQNLLLIEENIKKYFMEHKLEEEQKQQTLFNEKWQIMEDLKQSVKKQDSMLKDFGKQFTNLENVLSKTNCDSEISKLDERISKNFTVLQNIDKSLTKIVNGEDNKLICTTHDYPKNCAEYNENDCSNNKCLIYNSKYGSNPFLVSCDNHTEGAKWTVIQRRINGSVDFYRDWIDYKNGFGNIDAEFFIGLDKLHALTTTHQPMELMILLKDFNDTLKYARYDEFVVANEINNYKLQKVGKYSGDAGDSFSYHMGEQFSTKDRDNDVYDIGSCAIGMAGAWWYYNCCISNLNAKYSDSPKLSKAGKGVYWKTFRGSLYALKFVQMMIRPRR